jgi:hypothetical protein
VAIRQLSFAGTVPCFDVLILFALKSCDASLPGLVTDNSPPTPCTSCAAYVQVLKCPATFIGRPPLTPGRRAAAGMVGETGEATARFLRSVAAGEVDARDAIARAAAVGLKRLQTPPSPLPAQPQHVSQQLARPLGLRVYP